MNYTAILFENNTQKWMQDYEWNATILLRWEPKYLIQGTLDFPCILLDELSVDSYWK